MTCKDFLVPWHEHYVLLVGRHFDGPYPCLDPLSLCLFCSVQAAVTVFHVAGRSKLENELRLDLGSNTVTVGRVKLKVHTMALSLHYAVLRCTISGCTSCSWRLIFFSCYHAFFMRAEAFATKNTAVDCLNPFERPQVRQLSLSGSHLSSERAVDRTDETVESFKGVDKWLRFHRKKLQFIILCGRVGEQDWNGLQQVSNFHLSINGYGAVEHDPSEGVGAVSRNLFSPKRVGMLLEYGVCILLSLS